MPDSINIRDLNVDCMIGVNADERQRTQRLVIQVELQLNIDRAATLDRLDLTVDYEAVCSQILFLLHLGQFRLLETACQVVCRTLLLPPTDGERRAAIESCKIRIDKPEGLAGQALPGVQVTRRAVDVSYSALQTAYGTLDVVHETPELGIYRKNLAPGASVPVHLHRNHQEAEMLISHGVRVQNGAGTLGSVRLWPSDCPHGYGNPTDMTQSVLCVSRPPYTPEDEILVQGEGIPVAPLHPRDLGELRTTESTTRYSV
jgi:dihydroneopterin aldolase